MTVPLSVESRVVELERRNAELIAAVVARNTFIAVAAHELRNPMVPIIGHIDFLKSKVRANRWSPDQVEKALESLKRNVSHFVKRAEVLLDVSRINSGKFKLALEPLDLTALVRDIGSDFAGVAQRTGVSIEVVVPDTLCGIWDRLAVEQILDNLVSNALKYGAGTPVELATAIDGDQVRIQVRDHGEGISTTDRQRVFEDFERVVGSSEQRNGFGVGLWVVRQLAEAMGGAVAIEDAPGGGALFTVTLPRYTRETSD